MTKVNPMASMPGFDAMRAQQAAFFKAMTGGVVPGAGPDAKASKTGAGDDLEDIKAQLAAMQEKLSKLGK